MKIILNTTRYSSERYSLIEGGMGSFSLESNHPAHKYSIVKGRDMGKGYPCYMTIDCFMETCVYPEAKITLLNVLGVLGYEYSDGKWEID